MASRSPRLAGFDGRAVAVAVLLHCHAVVGAGDGWRPLVPTRPVLGRVDADRWRGDWERVPEILLPRGPLDPEIDENVRELVDGERKFRRPVWPQVVDGNGNPRRQSDRLHEVRQELGRVPWPDVRGLERVDAALDPQQPERSTLCWLVASTPQSITVLHDDLTLRTAAKSFDVEVRVIDYEVEIRERLRWLRAKREKREHRHRCLAPFSAECRPTAARDAAFHHAVFCRSRGLDEASRELLEWAIHDGETPLESIARARRHRHYVLGLDAFTIEGDAEAALTAWQRIVDRFPESDSAKGTADQIRRLRLTTSSGTPRATPDDLADRPADEQVAHWVSHLQYVAAWQYTDPGHCRVIDEGARRDDAAHQLRRIGKPAIPTLIDLLHDERLTRSRGGPWGTFYVLQYRDAAVQILEAIANERFYQPSSTSSYLSNETPERREAAIAEVRAWWERNRDRTEAEWLRESLVREKVANFGWRIDAARRLIALEGKGSIEFFRDRLAVEARSPWMLRLLWESGGVDVLPDVRAFADAEDEDMRSQSFRILIEAGDPPSLRRAVSELVASACAPEPGAKGGSPGLLLKSGDADAREAVCRVLSTGNTASVHHVLRSFEDDLQPWAMPHVAGRLIDRRRMPDERWRICDRAAVILAEAHELPWRPGYRDAEADRDEAIDRIREWWVNRRSAGGTN